MHNPETWPPPPTRPDEAAGNSKPHKFLTGYRKWDIVLGVIGGLVLYAVVDCLVKGPVPEAGYTLAVVQRALWLDLIPEALFFICLVWCYPSLMVTYAVTTLLWTLFNYEALGIASMFWASS